MTLILRIDGSAHTGMYEARCGNCGEVWTGQGEPIGAVNWSPMLPVAECVVHAKLGHDGQQVDLRFSDRYRGWLINYWERASMRIAAAGNARRRAIARARLGTQ